MEDWRSVSISFKRLMLKRPYLYKTTISRKSLNHHQFSWYKWLYVLCIASYNRSVLHHCGKEMIVNKKKKNSHEIGLPGHHCMVRANLAFNLPTSLASACANHLKAWALSLVGILDPTQIMTFCRKRVPSSFHLNMLLIFLIFEKSRECLKFPSNNKCKICTWEWAQKYQ